MINCSTTNATAPSLMRQVFNTSGHKIMVACLLFLVSFNIRAATWHEITPNISFLQQPKAQRFYDSNQVVIKGKKCALIFDASGDFSAAERMVVNLKKSLKVPVCYLVASQYQDDHLLGMAVLQHYFKDAKLIVHAEVAAEFTQMQKNFNDKLESYEQSIELSYQRLANLPKDQQANWRAKLDSAKKRLFRWQKYQLQPPAIKVQQSLTLDLGDYPVEITAYQAHTNADLTLFSPQEGILAGGDIVDFLPYAGHANLPSWISTLNTIKQNKAISLLLPGHGKPYKNKQLAHPIDFLNTIISSVNNAPNKSIDDLKSEFPPRFAEKYQSDEVSQKIYPIFLAAGLNRVKQSK